MVDRLLAGICLGNQPLETKYFRGAPPPPPNVRHPKVRRTPARLQPLGSWRGLGRSRRRLPTCLASLLWTRGGPSLLKARSALRHQVGKGFVTHYATQGQFRVAGLQSALLIQNEGEMNKPKHPRAIEVLGRQSTFGVASLWQGVRILRRSSNPPSHRCLEHIVVVPVVPRAIGFPCSFLLKLSNLWDKGEFFGGRNVNEAKGLWQVHPLEVAFST